MLGSDDSGHSTPKDDFEDIEVVTNLLELRARLRREKGSLEPILD